MKDLIDRQDAINALNKLDVSDGVGISSVACDLQKEAIHSIENLPAAQPYTDAEIQKIQGIEQAQFDKIRELAYQEGKADAMAEIIRCRDCRYKYGSDCDNFAGVLVEDDYFCSMAERREVSE